MSKVENVLGDNIGFVELVDSMGNDLTIVNSARVSFGKRKTVLDQDDIKLINYLAKNKHWSPFRHVQFQFHVKAPEIVARQLYKHIVGSDYAFKDHAWNEISGRYIIYNEEFYTPRVFRKQSPSNKQASIDESVSDHGTVETMYNDCIDYCYEAYEGLLERGVCKEQARGVLPVSFYTEWYWTASAQAVINLIQLRDDNHAQWESRQYGLAFKSLIQSVIPNAYQAIVSA